MKKGFIFIETVAVLLVVSIVLITLLTTYSLVIKKAEISKKYDRPNELYALYTIFNIGTTPLDNYLVDNSEFLCTKTNGNDNWCHNLKFISDDERIKLLNDLNITQIGIIKLNKNDISCDSYDNGLCSYLEYLNGKVSKNGYSYYAVGVFNINGKYYYASIKLADNNDSYVGG